MAAWCAAQGLVQRRDGPLADTVAATGWIRTLGGVEGYLALAARHAGLTAAAVHAAVAAGDLRVVPAVRGCIYLVPRAHVGLALALARDLSARRNARDMERVGVEPAELAEVGHAVLAHLADAPASTAALRRALPDGTIRSLGAIGKKVGVSSTLPPALRELEFSGRIVRRPADSRLDSERYDWQLADGTTRPDPRDPAARSAALAQVFLRSYAPASVAAFAAWSGLGKTACRKALTAIGAEPVHVDGEAMVRLPGQDLAAPAHPVRLLPGLDNLYAWHPASAFVHPDDLDRPARVWGGPRRTQTWREVTQPFQRTVVAGGRVCGVYEFDPDRAEVVTAAYTPGLPDGTASEAAAVSALLREIGHGRAFSLEKDDHLRARVAALG